MCRTQRDAAAAMATVNTCQMSQTLGMTGCTESRGEPLAGKSIVIIHPAWHSCGSHAVFCTQAAAYAALHANAASLAVGTTLHRGSHAHRFWSEYYSMTAELGAARYHTGPSRMSFLLSSAGMKAALRMLTGNYARQLADLSELSPIPHEILQAARIDLIHCNHYLF
jgi:polysaccharide biosynthesis protein PslH